MFEPDQYALLDIGDGRKLERFGGMVLDRPSPAAEAIPRAEPELWVGADARFVVERNGAGQWSDASVSTPLGEAEPWALRHGDVRLELELAASGNVGVFPEQADNWDWIAAQVKRCGADEPARLPRVLNLFAYTGGASLAAAAAGAEVTHVDASGPTVAWAKRNAAISDMADLPVRWLVEDAMKFAARECRRGNYYDGVILDPPTYGHGPKGRPFKFRQHVDELLALCGELLGPQRPSNRFLLFSCHVPGFGHDDAASAVESVLPDAVPGAVASHPLTLNTSAGRKLAAGVAARWCAPPR